MEPEKIIIIHALDYTTSFLSIFHDKFLDNLNLFVANEDSKDQIIKILNDLPEDVTIVFLGHGHSTGLYTPENRDNYPKHIFINDEIGNIYFKNKNVLLLSCNSCQFINGLGTYSQIIGFGNIISSRQEVINEGDYAGKYRELEDNDIDMFNTVYCKAIIKALCLFRNKTILFEKVPQYIEFYINKEINNILKNKEINNRIEIARLLFEFRNEMVYKSNY